MGGGHRRCLEQFHRGWKQYRPDHKSVSVGIRGPAGSSPCKIGCGLGGEPREQVREIHRRGGVRLASGGLRDARRQPLRHAAATDELGHSEPIGWRGWRWRGRILRRCTPPSAPPFSASCLHGPDALPPARRPRSSPRPYQVAEMTEEAVAGVAAACSSRPAQLSERMFTPLQ